MFYPSVLLNPFVARDSATTYRPLSPEAIDFLQHHMQKLFPDKTPAKVTILIDLEKFPLDRPADRTVIAPVTEREIVFP